LNTELIARGMERNLALQTVRSAISPVAPAGCAKSIRRESWQDAKLAGCRFSERLCLI